MPCVTSMAAAARPRLARSRPSPGAVLTKCPTKARCPARSPCPAPSRAGAWRLPLKRCLESAIGYARDGFPVTARLAHWRNAERGNLSKSPEAAAIFLKDGAVLTNPDLARTLEAIASDGW